MCGKMSGSGGEVEGDWGRVGGKLGKVGEKLGEVGGKLGKVGGKWGEVGGGWGGVGGGRGGVAGRLRVSVEHYAQAQPNRTAAFPCGSTSPTFLPYSLAPYVATYHPLSTHAPHVPCDSTTIPSST